VQGGICTHCGKPLRVDPPGAPGGAESPAAQAARAHFAAFAQSYALTLPAEKGAAIPLPLRQQRAEGGFYADSSEPKSGGAVIPADGYYILLWETGVTRTEGAAALELGGNDGGSVLAERLEAGYYSGQQHSWFNQHDRVTLRLRSAAAEDDAEPTGATVAGATAQLTVIRLG
jgi:hypothetical protein